MTGHRDLEVASRLQMVTGAKGVGAVTLGGGQGQSPQDHCHLKMGCKDDEGGSGGEVRGTVGHLGRDSLPEEGG